MKQLESRIEGRDSEHARMVGAIIRQDRKNAGYTIRALAEKMDISPTHLTRIESGKRVLDSVVTLILFCEACNVPIEKYLVLSGMKLDEKDTPVRRAFPSISNQEQENAVAAFAELITSKNLTSDNISQMLDTATAFADFCDKKNQ